MAIKRWIDVGALASSPHPARRRAGRGAPPGPILVAEVDGKTVVVGGQERVLACGAGSVEVVELDGDLAGPATAVLEGRASPRDRLALFGAALAAGLNQRDAARSLGVDEGEASKWSRILRLRGTAVWPRFEAGEVKLSQLVTLSRLEDASARDAALERILREGLSVRGARRALLERPAAPRVEPASVEDESREPEAPAAHELVEVPGTGILLARWTGGQDLALVPPLDPRHVFDARLVAALAPVFEPSAGAALNALLTGGAATGKTTTLLQLCAVVGAPVVLVEASPDATRDLIERMELVGGVTRVVRGPATLAFERGLALLLDEVSAHDPAAIHATHGLLAGSPTIRLSDGTVVRRHPGFRVLATSNVVGAAAARRARFAGQRPLGEATLSRFGIKVHVREPDEATLEAALRRAAGSRSCPDLDEQLPRIAGWFVDLRRAATGDDARMSVVVSFRHALAFLELWLRPLETRAGQRRRRVREVAEFTVLADLETDAERELALELLHSRFGPAA